jgi:hypothetical protein
LRRELLCLRVPRVPNALGSAGEGVGRVPQLDVGPEQEPIGARLPERIPTLPAFTTRIPPTFRSNCMWVCPQTAMGTLTQGKADRRRFSGVKRVNTSVSLRGMARQKQYLA